MAPYQESRNGNRSEDIDDAEKGLYDNTKDLPILPPLAHVDKAEVVHVEVLRSPLSPLSPVHEGITPSSSVPVLTLSRPAVGESPSSSSLESKNTKPAPPKPKISRWILFRLWFNTYRKFFTFVTLLNLAGLIMTALGRFPYAENHIGALVLGNLLFAVLMRNELFLRFLYLVAIYGLRSVG